MTYNEDCPNKRKMDSPDATIKNRLIKGLTGALLVTKPMKAIQSGSAYFARICNRETPKSLRPLFYISR